MGRSKRVRPPCRRPADCKSDSGGLRPNVRLRGRARPLAAGARSAVRPGEAISNRPALRRGLAVATVGRRGRLQIGPWRPSAKRRRLWPPCRALRAPRGLRRRVPCPQGHVRPSGQEKRFRIALLFDAGLQSRRWEDAADYKSVPGGLRPNVGLRRRARGRRGLVCWGERR